jgi:hypothetical protein
MIRVASAALVLAASVAAQFAGGSIYTSLDAAQYSGVTQIAVPGNPYLSTGEILVYASGMSTGARSLWNAESLGVLLGDRDADGLPNDWLNVDALHFTATTSGVQPRPFDAMMSFEYDLLNASGGVVISSGDVFRSDRNRHVHDRDLARPARPGRRNDGDAQSRRPRDDVRRHAHRVVQERAVVDLRRHRQPHPESAERQHRRGDHDLRIRHSRDSAAVGDRARRPSLAFGRPQHDRRPIRVLEHHGSPRLRPATERGFDFEPLRPPRWLGVRNPPAPRVFTVRIGRRDLHQPRGQSRRIHQHVVGRSGHVRRPARRSPRTGSTNRVALDALALSPYLRFPRGSAITVGVTDAAGTPIGPALRRGQSVPLRFTRAESSRTAPTARCARLHLVGTSLSTAFGYPFVTGGFGHRGPEPNDPFLLATDHRRLRPRS